MAHRIDDRWLWVGLGVCIFIGIKAVSYGLRTIVELTEIHNDPPKPRIPPPPPSERIVDQISISSLQTLATGNNVMLRHAATRLLCDRFLSNNYAVELLMHDAFSSHTNPEAKRRAELAMRLLIEYTDEELVKSFHRGDLARTLTMSLVGSGGLENAVMEGGEGESRRRRHREAVVFNEGDHPVNEDDVYMR